MTCRPVSSAGRRTVLRLLALAGAGLAVPLRARADGVTLADIKASGALKVGMALNPPMVLQNMSGGWRKVVPNLGNLVDRPH